MYVETRTTADEVLDSLVKELRCMANGLRNSAHTRTVHPTFISVPELRAKANRLRGAWALALSVAGSQVRLGDEVQKSIDDALNAALVHIKKF